MNSSIRDQILAKYKEEYISLLKSTEREGIDSLKLAFYRNGFLYCTGQHQQTRFI